MHLGQTNDLKNFVHYLFLHGTQYYLNKMKAKVIQSEFGSKFSLHLVVLLVSLSLSNFLYQFKQTYNEHKQLN